LNLDFFIVQVRVDEAKYSEGKVFQLSNWGAFSVRGSQHQKTPKNIFFMLFNLSSVS
jgi:hypothetical protein